MKKIKLIIVLMILLCPINVYASGSGTVVGGDTGNIPAACNTNCTPGTRSSAGGGIRISFVDSHGNTKAGSFDFITNYSYSSHQVLHNNAQGPKTKIGDYGSSFETVSNGMRSLPGFAALIQDYNTYTGVSTYTVTGDETGGACFNAGYGTERGFINLLAPRSSGSGDSKLAQSITNVNAFMKAIQKFYPEFDANAFMLTVYDECEKGNYIYILWEPLCYYTGSGSDQNPHFLGSHKDYVTYFGSMPINPTDSAKKMVYDRDVNPSDAAFMAALMPYHGETISSAEEIMNSNVGWGAGVNWIQIEDGEGCSSFGCLSVGNNKITVDGYVYPSEAGDTLKLEEYMANKHISLSVPEYVYSPEGANCCMTLADAYSKHALPADLQSTWEQYCQEEEQGDCCNLDPLELGKIDGAVNNCCLDNGGHSQLDEYLLDQLFCDDLELDVDKYWNKCKNDYYIDDNASLNDYCDMYCTERMDIQIPESLSSVSGRYFTLTPNPVGSTTSPYLEGYKRCRMKVYYDVWEEQYYDVVDSEINSYNSFQHNKAYEYIYNEAIGDSRTHPDPHIFEASCDLIPHSSQGSPYKCGTGYSPTRGSYDIYCSCPSAPLNSPPALPSPYRVPLTYTMYYFPNGLSKFPYYHEVKADADLEAKHTNVKIIFKETKNTRHRPWGAGMEVWEEIENEANWISSNSQDGLNENSNFCGSKSWWEIKCHRDDDPTEAEANDTEHEVVPDVYNDYKQKAIDDNDAYNDYCEKAKDMEDDLSTCDYFFYGKDIVNAGEWIVKTAGQEKAENMYQVETTMDFKYYQIYLNERGESQLLSSFIPFEDTPGCKVDGPFTLDKAGSGAFYDRAVDINEKRYSDTIYSRYTKEYNEAEDFKKTTLDWKKEVKGYEEYLHDLYKAGKVFTHDAKYQSICEWEEGENNKATLVHNGSVAESSEYNYTAHDHEYSVYITSYVSEFETEWGIRSIGERGKFDRYVVEGHQNCDGTETNGSASFSCVLSNDYEIVYTGQCNGHRTTKNPDDCTPIKEGFDLFEFKVVDPSNLFPSGSGVNFAYNWLVKGTDVKNDIETRGNQNMTYNENQISYSFRLTPTTMRHIKNYNDAAENEGGYTDFDLICTCPSGSQTNTLNGGGKGCTECHSPFVEDLYDNKITYHRSTYSGLNTNLRREDVREARAGAHWVTG